MSDETHGVIYEVIVIQGLHGAFLTLENRYIRRVSDACILASFSGSPSPFLTFFRTRILHRNFEGPGMEPRPPVYVASHDHDHGGHALHCAQCRSHTALCIVATSLRSHKSVSKL